VSYRFQFSVFSFQFSVFGFRFSVFGFQWRSHPSENRKLKTENFNHQEPA